MKLLTSAITLWLLSTGCGAVSADVDVFDDAYGHYGNDFRYNMTMKTHYIYPVRTARFVQLEYLKKIARGLLQYLNLGSI